jgi:hypothetical protein
VIDSPAESRAGAPLRTLADWEAEAGPAKTEHWVDGRSAKELARAWLSGEAASALTGLLESDSSLSGFTVTRAVAEAQTSFDNWPGGKRNHDVLVSGSTAGGTTVVGVEAKADETFGQTLDAYARSAERLIEKNERTNAPERLNELVQNLCGTTLEADPALGILRYQLFSGVAGMLAAAAETDAEQAAFVVIEFVTDKTTSGRRSKNANDFVAFTGRVMDLRPDDPRGNWLLGPWTAPAEQWADIQLWLGKLRLVRTAEPDSDTS